MLGNERPRITKRQMRKAAPENVRRLARWLRVRNIDTMSHRQLIRFLDWLFKRADKKMRGMAWEWRGNAGDPQGRWSNSESATSSARHARTLSIG